MTANPNWPEIQDALMKDDNGNPVQTAADWPNIVAHVFEIKKNALVKEVQEGLFNPVQALVHTIKF